MDSIITKKQQDQFYYEDDSLTNLQENLRRGLVGGSNRGNGADKNIKKKSSHNFL